MKYLTLTIKTLFIIFSLLVVSGTNQFAFAAEDKDLLPGKEKVTEKLVGIFVSTTGDDNKATVANGVLGRNKESSYKTIAKAMEVAKPGDTIFVAAGKYDGQVNLKSGITIKGGYLSNFSEISKLSNDILKSEIKKIDDKIYNYATILTNSSGDRVILGQDLQDNNNSPVYIENLVVVGPSLPQDIGDEGRTYSRSSYGIVAQDNKVSINLHNIKVIAGRGESGLTGAQGQQGDGYTTQGGDGGVAEQVNIQIKQQKCYSGAGGGGCSDPIWQKCKNHVGNPGKDVVISKRIFIKGGTGGQCDETSGCMSRLAWHSGKNEGLIQGKKGGDGKPGTPGVAGVGGKIYLNSLKKQSAFFSVKGKTLVFRSESVGGKGNNGVSGAGGGGGSAGESSYVIWTNCKGAPGDLHSGRTLLGGTGGQGGRGGVGGEGGGGGGQGGGAFGLVIKDAIVNTQDISILMGTGGRGGDGGGGGGGKTGETGVSGEKVDLSESSKAENIHRKYDTCNGTTLVAGDGGNGGNGGQGGSGGGGAGGNGGLSIGVALIGKGKILRKGLFYIYGGIQGKPGYGGNPDGEYGALGIITSQHKFEFKGS